MSKITGLGITTLSVDDSGGTVRAIKNDFTEFSFSTPRGVQDWTGVDKSAIERGLLLADFSISLKGAFSDAVTTSAHAVFSTVPSSSVARTTTITITGGSARTLPNEVIYTDYAITRASSGELTYEAPGVLSDGTVPTWA